MRFDLVIFDCDGVLVDSELLSIRADLECLAEHGIAISGDELLERYTGISMAGMLADLETRYGRRLPGFEQRHQARLEALFAAELTAVAGIETVLDRLSPGTACVASSGTPQRIRHALACTGLFDRLDPHIFSATMVEHGKPAPDLFLYAAARMGVARSRCVVIEDSLPGIAAAVAAEMTAIGFCGGSHCRPGHAARLTAAGATSVIERLEELQSLLL